MTKHTHALGRTTIALALALGMASLPFPAAAAALAEHVIVIGCDGMSPDGIAHANTPHLDRMMAEGAWTMHARGVMPTSSSPNWASMIMGAGPEQHGVTSNGWELNKFAIAPTATGTGGIFPTIFSLLRAQKKPAVIGCFHDWGGFGRLFAHEDLDVVENTEGPKATTDRAAAFIAKQKPTLTFIHLDHVDHVGHDKGHGTPEYYAAVEEADRYIGQVIAAVANAGISETTAIIVTSDHGGRGKGHGGATMDEIEIPWIVTGPAVKNGYTISSPVNTYDTAATAMYLLDVTPHPAWIARPVLEAFEK